MQELKVLDESSCRNFVRMHAAMFEELIGMVAPLIIRNDAKMRQSISRTTSSDITVAADVYDFNIMLYKHGRCSYNSMRLVINSVVQQHYTRDYRLHTA